MNKTFLLSMAIFISFAAGCEKKPFKEASEPPSIENIVHDTHIADAFQQADDKITTLTDQIENPELSESQRHQVLCQDFPKTYKNEYIPALLALNSQDTNQAQLLAEMQFTLNYYQQQFNIKCS
jgi:hypothetical protein